MSQLYHQFIFLFSFLIYLFVKVRFFTFLTKFLPTYSFNINYSNRELNKFQIMNLELRSKFLVSCKEDLFFFFILTNFFSCFRKFSIFQGPFESDYPAKLEATVRDGPVRCISFNKRGTMLAGGCSDGYCIIWDFQSMSIIRKMRCHVSSVTSVR